MQIIKIGKENINLLQNFINELKNSEKHFRYFNSRDISIIQNHLLTILLIDGEENYPIGYGHLDKDGDDLWLGICILSEYQGKGLGKKIMNYLIDFAQQKNVSQIKLTVDNDNILAIKLYEKLGFIQIKKDLDKKNYLYILNING